MSLARFIKVREEYKDKQLLLVKHFVELEKDFENELAVCQSTKKRTPIPQRAIRKRKGEDKESREVFGVLCKRN